eukprot:GHRR01015170.1.p2 GENE.GHRR01015170.1~~GHRR01015170.1.p2  ORF type:complete len:147 (-),score=26.54 GHRR01015170.1:663-1103(-)
MRVSSEDCGPPCNGDLELLEPQAFPCSFNSLQLLLVQCGVASRHWCLQHAWVPQACIAASRQQAGIETACSTNLPLLHIASWCLYTLFTGTNGSRKWGVLPASVHLTGRACQQQDSFSTGLDLTQLLQLLSQAANLYIYLQIIVAS